jgi:hypothetical protein
VVRIKRGGAPFVCGGRGRVVKVKRSGQRSFRGRGIKRVGLITVQYIWPTAHKVHFIKAINYGVEVQSANSFSRQGLRTVGEYSCW